MRSIVVLLALVLAACTTNPKRLEIVKAETELRLAKPFEFTVDRSSIACKFLYKYVLVSGTLTAKFQDQEGVYFVGSPKNINEQQLVASCAPTGAALGNIFADGGVWLPNDKTKPAKIFYFLKYNIQSLRPGHLLVDLAAMSEDGNIWFPPQPAEPSLRAALDKS